MYKVEEIEKHVETGHCKIEEGVDFEDRINNYCIEHDLPAYIAQAASAKLDYLLENNYGAANAIDLDKIDRIASKNNGSEFIELRNGDALQFNGDEVVYVKSKENKEGMTY